MEMSRLDFDDHHDVSRHPMWTDLQIVEVSSATSCMHVSDAGSALGFLVISAISSASRLGLCDIPTSTTVGL